MDRVVTPEDVRVRPATERDLPGVESVAREAWHATYAGALSSNDIDSFLQAHYSQEALRRRLASLERGFVVARVADEVIAFACLGRNRDEELELFAIYVLPAHQGRGVGSALWRAVEDEVRRLDALEFHLWVLTSNLNATNFYTGKGGRAVDRRTYQVGEAEISETRFVFRLAP